MTYRPTTEEVYERREMTRNGIVQCRKELQLAWLEAQIAALPAGRMREILQTMLDLAI